MMYLKRVSTVAGLAALACFVLALSSHAQLSPITLTGYNLAGIVNAATPVSPTDTTAITNALNASTGGVNGASLDGQYVYTALGFNANIPAAGLPVGSTFTSSATTSTAGAVTFAIMPANPTTATNNVLDCYAALPSATLTLSTPAMYSNLAFLENGYNGNQTVTYTLNYATGTPVTGSFTALDNFNGAAANTAFYADGRVGVVSATGGNYHVITATSATVVGSNPRLYQIDLAADPTRVLNSVTFASTTLTATRAGFGVFGISGKAVSAAATPEPGTIALLALSGLPVIGMVARCRRTA